MCKPCITSEVFEVLLVIALSAGCTSRADDVAIRPIAGTEQVAIEAFCISVSPDERWLTFVEWKLPRAVLRKELPRDEYDRRIASLNLQTGDRNEYPIESVSPNALGFSENDKRWKYHAGFRIVRDAFRPPGWREQTFYFQRYSRSTFLALEPSRPGIVIVAEPDTPGTCSDCPPIISAQFRDRAWDLLSNEVSAVVRDGGIRCIYYRGEGPYRTNLILRLEETGQEEVIVERERRKGTILTIACVRISPDDRFLAYVVHSKKQALLSGPTEEIFVLEISTRVEKKLAQYSYVGNLIWSPDGNRLYFAGGEYSSDCAVFVADVPAAFSR